MNSKSDSCEVSAIASAP